MGWEKSAIYDMSKEAQPTIQQYKLIRMFCKYNNDFFQPGENPVAGWK